MNHNNRYMLFFISNDFFHLSLTVARRFSEWSLKCCLSVPYCIETLSKRDLLYFVYLSLCLRLVLFTSYLCDLFFHYHFHFN